MKITFKKNKNEKTYELIPKNKNENYILKNRKWA